MHSMKQTFQKMALSCSSWPLFKEFLLGTMGYFAVFARSFLAQRPPNCKTCASSQDSKQEKECSALCSFVCPSVFLQLTTDDTKAWQLKICVRPFGVSFFPHHCELERMKGIKKKLKTMQSHFFRLQVWQWTDPKCQRFVEACNKWQH